MRRRQTSRSWSVYATTVGFPVVPEDAWNSRISLIGTARTPYGYASRRSSFVVKGRRATSSRERTSSGRTFAGLCRRLWEGPPPRRVAARLPEPPELEITEGPRAQPLHRGLEVQPSPPARAGRTARKIRIPTEPSQGEDEEGGPPPAPPPGAGAPPPAHRRGGARFRRAGGGPPPARRREREPAVRHGREDEEQGQDVHPVVQVQVAEAFEEPRVRREEAQDRDVHAAGAGERAEAHEQSRGRRGGDGPLEDPRLDPRPRGPGHDVDRRGAGGGGGKGGGGPEGDDRDGGDLRDEVGVLAHDDRAQDPEADEEVHEEDRVRVDPSHPQDLRAGRADRVQEGDEEEEDREGARGQAVEETRREDGGQEGRRRHPGAWAADARLVPDPVDRC